MAELRAKLSHHGLRWALEAIVVQHMTVARIAEALTVVWSTADDAVPADGKRVPINAPARSDGVKVMGIDENIRRHTRKGRQVPDGHHRPDRDP